MRFRIVSQHRISNHEPRTGFMTLFLNVSLNLKTSANTVWYIFVIFVLSALILCSRGILKFQGMIETARNIDLANRINTACNIVSGTMESHKSQWLSYRYFLWNSAHRTFWVIMQLSTNQTKSSSHLRSVFLRAEIPVPPRSHFPCDLGKIWIAIPVEPHFRWNSDWSSIAIPVQGRSALPSRVMSNFEIWRCKLADGFVSMAASSVALSKRSWPLRNCSSDQASEKFFGIPPGLVGLGTPALKN